VNRPFHSTFPFPLLEVESAENMEFRCEIWRWALAGLALRNWDSAYDSQGGKLKTLIQPKIMQIMNIMGISFHLTRHKQAGHFGSAGSVD